MRLLVPAYAHWSRTETWDRWLALPAGTLLVLNPASGAGISLGRVAEWRSIRDRAKAAGIDVAGYVAVGYGRRSPREIEDELEAWRRWYEPDVMFVDECPTRADSAPFLRGLVAACAPQRVVLNPGTVPSSDLWDQPTLREIVWVTYEGPHLPPRGWASGLDVRRQCWLRYGSPNPGADLRRMTRHRRKGLGYGYATSDPGCTGNPWDDDPQT